MFRIVGITLVAALAVGLAAPELERIAATAPDAAPPDAAPPAALAAASSGYHVEIAADPSGHFALEGEIGGRRLTLLADTGATLVALRASDARRAGLTILSDDFRVPVTTANGRVNGARVRLHDLAIRDIRIADVDAIVLPDAALATNLLGMSFLGRLAKFQVSGGRLVLDQ